MSRFADLTVAEVSDLFGTVHLIAPKLQEQFQTTSLTIAIQVSNTGQMLSYQKILDLGKEFPISLRVVL